jgi:hypothetical protein
MAVGLGLAAAIAPLIALRDDAEGYRTGFPPAEIVLTMG